MLKLQVKSKDAWNSDLYYELIVFWTKTLQNSAQILKKLECIDEANSNLYFAKILLSANFKKLY